ncbi:MAG: nucleotidyl transferase AbiEii/AbiGii toxin family protein [Gammaproteobacteria bacterium]|nr:nucleotidyl transferase AbiEii/AbiGii toxin family protein [Gammaproteobacteria bacterium]MCY4357330.1 nucleotidyl transferase AbiEii/AbiGii toxin family protein [Gammaproteobacteria bacterium]
MGGGTVLQARWGHRASCDVDMFCESDVFAHTHRNSGKEIENLLIERAGADPQRTWMEYMALYCEIGGIEVTMLPHTFIFEREVDGVLPGIVPLGLQSSAEILAKKLRHRLHATGSVEVRDIYDLAYAIDAEPNVFSKAKLALSPVQCVEAATLLSQLPTGWSKRTIKPLIEPVMEWDEVTLTEIVRNALITEIP